MADLREALQRMGMPAAAATYAVDTMHLDTLDLWRDLQMDDDLGGDLEDDEWDL